MRLTSLILLLSVSVALGFGAFTEQRIDRIRTNTESFITMIDDVIFDAQLPNTVPVLDGNKTLVSSTVTDTELGYLSGTATSVQFQLDDKASLTQNNVFTGVNSFQDRLVVATTSSPSLPCPVMTILERDALSSPIAGDCVYNSDTLTLNVYDGAEWALVGGGGLSKWSSSEDYDIDTVVWLQDDFRIYRAKSTFTSGASFNPANWDQLSPLSGIFEYSPLSARPPTPSEGTVYYDDGTTNKKGITVYDGSNWKAVGGGNGDPSIYAILDAEDKSVIGFSGLQTNTSSPLAGEVQYEDTSFPIETPLQSVPLRSKNKENAIVFEYALNSGTIRAAAVDNSGNTIGEVELKSTGSVTSGQSVALPFYPGTSVNSVKLVITNVSGASGIRLDDIIFTDRTLIFKSLENSEFVFMRGRAGFGSSNTTTPYFSSTVNNTTGKLIEVTNNSTSGFIVTALQAVRISGILVNSGPSGTVYTGIVKNSSNGSSNVATLTGNGLVTYNSQNVAGGAASQPFEIDLNPGDTLQPQVDSAGNFSGAENTSRWRIAIRAVQKENDHLIIPGRNNGQLFTARISNNGSTASILSQGGRNADGQHAIASVSRTGTGRIDVTYTSGFFAETPAVIGATGDSSAYTSLVTWRNESTSGLSLFTYESAGGSLQDFDFDISFARTGNDLDGATAITYAIPLSSVTYLKDVKPPSTPAGGSISGTQTRVLNSKYVFGLDFVTLSANQFTLPPGEYLIDAEAPVYQVGGHQAWIYNVTDSTVETRLVSNPEEAPAGRSSTVRLMGPLSINSTKTFELRHYTRNAVGTRGLGDEEASGQDQIYSQIRIEKVK